MNHTRTLHTLGSLVALLGLMMVIPLGISLAYGERDWASFLISMTVTTISGLVMRAAFRPHGGFGHKDGFLTVSLGWIIAAAVCALPFLLAGSVPTFTDAYFEAMSGFTTTGATILTEIDGQPHGILFWRSFLHWLGGMGIVVLFLADLPNLGPGNHRLFNAEVPGHIQTKLEPFAPIPALGKWVLSASMLLGRLELYTVLVLLAPSFWRRY